jgi:hypothetical protein
MRQTIDVFQEQDPSHRPDDEPRDVQFPRRLSQGGYRDIGSIIDTGMMLSQGISPGSVPLVMSFRAVLPSDLSTLNIRTTGRDPFGSLFFLVLGMGNRVLLHLIHFTFRIDTKKTFQYKPP